MSSLRALVRLGAEGRVFCSAVRTKVAAAGGGRRGRQLLPHE